VWLFLKDDRRPADTLPFKVDDYLYVVNDLDERNTIVHTVFLTVEGHRPRNRARSCSFTGNHNSSFSGATGDATWERRRSLTSGPVCEYTAGLLPEPSV
jgi:hypothetical protein